MMATGGEDENGIAQHVDDPTDAIDGTADRANGIADDATPNRVDGRADGVTRSKSPVRMAARFPRGMAGPAPPFRKGYNDFEYYDDGPHLGMNPNKPNPVLPRLSIFAGNNSAEGVSFEQWMHEVLRMANSRLYDEKILLPHVERSLRSLAQEVIFCEEIDTLVELFEILDRHFGDVDNVNVTMADFFKATQKKGESMTKFLTRLKRMMRKIKASKAHRGMENSDTLIAAKFFGGLYNNEIRNIVRVNAGETAHVDKMYAAARKAESEVSERQILAGESDTNKSEVNKPIKRVVAIAHREADKTVNKQEANGNARQEPAFTLEMPTDTAEMTMHLMKNQNKQFQMESEHLRNKVEQTDKLNLALTMEVKNLSKQVAEMMSNQRQTEVSKPQVVSQVDTPVNAPAFAGICYNCSKHGHHSRHCVFPCKICLSPEHSSYVCPRRRPQKGSQGNQNNNNKDGCAQSRRDTYKKNECTVR
jgi:hypothetical protein